ncbi:hypothetical protein FQA39_LY19139 [Lamprigera yunnana]|nr:hypothetical protein FQA39_LY19139 [Lamprigera yunnana]
MHNLLDPDRFYNQEEIDRMLSTLDDLIQNQQKMIDEKLEDFKEEITKDPEFIKFVSLALIGNETFKQHVKDIIYEIMKNDTELQELIVRSVADFLDDNEKFLQAIEDAIQKLLIADSEFIKAVTDFFKKILKLVLEDINNNVSIGFATDDSFRINVAFSNFDDGLEERTTKLIAFSSVDFEMSANDYILKLNQETGVIKTLIDRITALETQLAGKQDALTFTDITYTMDDGTVIY